MVLSLFDQKGERKRDGNHLLIFGYFLLALHNALLNRHLIPFFLKLSIVAEDTKVKQKLCDVIIHVSRNIYRKQIFFQSRAYSPGSPVTLILSLIFDLALHCLV